MWLKLYSNFQSVFIYYCFLTWASLCYFDDAELCKWFVFDFLIEVFIGNPFTYSFWLLTGLKGLLKVIWVIFISWLLTFFEYKCIEIEPNMFFTFNLSRANLFITYRGVIYIASLTDLFILFIKLIIFISKEETKLFSYLLLIFLLVIYLGIIYYILFYLSSVFYVNNLFHISFTYKSV